MPAVVGLLKLEPKETTCDLLNCIYIAQYSVDVWSLGNIIPKKKK
jgi:hypothetical protein